MRTTHHALLILLLSVGSGMAADTEIRVRSNIVSADEKIIHYEIVEVIVLGDERESNNVLVRDTATGDRYVLDRVSDHKEQTATWKIRDPKGEQFLQASFKLPFTSRTQLETLREARENPQLFALPAILTIETNAGTWSGLQSQWEEWAELRKFRHEIRQGMPFNLLEGIERMRDSVLSQPVGQAFYRIVAKYAVYDTDDEKHDGLKTVRALPDCDFDSSFGFPCSEAQKKRLKKAAETGTAPERY